MKGYTCGELENERHRVRFGVLLVTNPHARKRGGVQRNFSCENGAGYTINDFLHHACHTAWVVYRASGG